MIICLSIVATFYCEMYNGANGDAGNNLDDNQVQWNVGGTKMASNNQEYERLGRHIEGQFRLIIQVFTASLIVSAPLLGYGLRVLSEINTNTNTVSHAVPFLVLTPLAILIPSAYLIGFLRKEIFKWGGYIKVYLEDGKELKYESELGKYRDKFPESESFNPIAFTYLIFIVICALAFGYGLHISSMSLLWLFVLVLPLCFVLYWYPNYCRIPNQCSQEYNSKWAEIRSDNLEAKEGMGNAHYQELNTKLEEIQKSITSLGQDLKMLAPQSEHSPFAPFYTAAGGTLFSVGVAMIGYLAKQGTLTENRFIGWLLLVFAGILFARYGLLSYLPKGNLSVRRFLRQLTYRDILSRLDIIFGVAMLVAFVVLVSI
jgi:hypothetical protein